MAKGKVRAEFDSTEFLLLTFVVIALLTVASWQMGFLPSFFVDNSSVLGLATFP